MQPMPNATVEPKSDPAKVAAVTARGLSIFFGNHAVLKNVSIDIGARGRDRHHWPQRLRQIHLSALHQPHA